MIKNYKKISKRCFVLLLSFATVSIFSLNSVFAANCGTSKPISIAQMSWSSADFLAHLVKKVLEDGYNCKTVLIPGDTVPTGATILAKQVPHIAPELWVSSLSEVWGKIRDKDVAFKAGESFANGGVEGLWIPDYIAKKHKIKTLSDLKKNWKLFTEPSSPDKGRIYGCPPGWVCEITTTNIFKAAGLGDRFELFSPGSGANLKASYARQVARKKAIVGYYWDPTAVTGRYKLVRLQLPKHNAKDWECISDKECKNPKVIDWPASPVIISAVTKLKTESPNVVRFLSKMDIPNNTVSDLLGWGDANKKTGEEMAEYFLKNNRKLWSKWVPNSASKKIRASL